MWPLAIAAQDKPAEDTTRALLQPVPVTEITLQATEINTRLREQRNLLLGAREKANIRNRLDTLYLKLYLLREDPRIHRTNALNLWQLEDLQTEWSYLDAELEEEQNRLTELLQEKENELAELARLQKLWELTAENIDEETAAVQVVEQINTTLEDIKETQKLFQEDSKLIQEELVEITDGVIFTNEVMENILASMETVTKNMLTLNSPPIWEEFGQKGDTILLKEQRSYIDDNVNIVSDFYNRFTIRIWIHLILSIFIIVSVLFLFRGLRRSFPDSGNPDIHTVRGIIEHPLSSGLLISLVLSFILYPDIPDSALTLLSILLFGPVVTILRLVFKGPSRKYVYYPLVAMILVQFHRIFYAETVFSRMWLLFVILYSIALLILILGRKRMRMTILSTRQGRLLIFLGMITLVFLLTAFLAGIVGALMLAEFLAIATIEAVNIGLFIFALIITLRSLITTIVFGKYARQFSLLSTNQELIYYRLKRIVNLFGVVLLAIFTMQTFNIWEAVWGWLNQTFTYQIQMGSMEFSLWNITLFFLIIWLTIWISRIIRIVFEGESTIRDRMRRGVPAALSLILRITLITLGFIIAVGAAGIALDKLAILLGALGVGIGFGLQSIFNNLVSGIILAFERPIKEGDIIEANNLLGTVKEIGIRSSIILTYDGSEVIVPNGNLISQDLINWTRSDMRRRGEVILGVKYGSDPQSVQNLLLEVVNNDDSILDDPPPMALFLGFGESSLDFRLLFWIPDADNRLQIQSAIAVKVERALKEAGIEIPFPQRDLHIRSVESRLMDKVSGLDKGKKT